MYILADMEEMAISKFKATCLEVVERVRKTRTPILITRHGVPVAQIISAAACRAAEELAWQHGGLGDDSGRHRWAGDDPDDWEAMRD